MNVFRALYTSALVNIKPVKSLLLQNGFAAALPQHTMEGNTAVTVCEGVTSEFRKTQFSGRCCLLFLNCVRGQTCWVCSLSAP